MTLRKITIALAWLAVLIVVPLYALKVGRNLEYTDFIVYRRAGIRASAADWNAIYNLVRDGNSPFRYAPATLPLFIPFGQLDDTWARIAWYLFQVAGYAVGFAALYRALKRVGLDAAWIVAASFLFSLRFLLDSFTIGQITGSMFACAGLALELSLRASAALEPGSGLESGLGPQRERAVSYGAWLALPVALKIGPALWLAPLVATSPRPIRALVRAGIGLLLVLGAASIAVSLWTGLPTSFLLWKNWWGLIKADSSFFDSSHYGSQSLNSALLRSVRYGMLTESVAIRIRGVLTGCGLVGLVALWTLRRPTGTRGVLSYFGLGILGYLLLMPFTFKYSVPLVAFPVAALLAGRKRRFEWIAFLFGALTMSVAGYDLIGADLFFAMQKSSVPLFAMILLTGAVSRQAWHQSKSRQAWQQSSPRETRQRSDAREPRS